MDAHMQVTAARSEPLAAGRQPSHMTAALSPVARLRAAIMILTVLALSLGAGGDVFVVGENTYQGLDTPVELLEGTLAVDDATYSTGTDSLFIGADHYEEACSIAVDGASDLVVGRDIYVGRLDGQRSELSVAGSDSTITLSSTEADHGRLYVGYTAGTTGSEGTLTVAAGGLLTSSSGLGQLRVGERAGDVGNVAVQGTVSNLYELHSGVNGTGTVAVSAGGQMFVTEAQVAVYDGSEGYLNVAGTGTAVTISGLLRVGYEGDAEVNITDGGTMTSGTTYISYKAQSTSVVTVNGSGSTWTVAGTSPGIYVGYAGTGVLNVEAGGQLSGDDISIGAEAGSSGTMTVTGSGSTVTYTGVLYTGYSGNGELTVSDGGQMVSCYDAYLGCDSDAGNTGTVTVTGEGSGWTGVDDLCVGYGGTGVLNIEAGGNVGNTDATTIGYSYDAPDTESAATVTGSGSTWTCGGETTVGYESKGSLTIEDGGQMTVGGAMFLGYSNGIDGTATVTGSGATLTAEADMIVGHYGNGSLTIAAGGNVESANAYLGDYSTGSAVVEITGSGSSWEAGQNLHVGVRGTGVLTVADGGQVSSGYAKLGDSSGSNGTVTVTGSGSLWMNTADALCVGYSGTGTLNIEAGGEVSSVHSVLVGQMGTGIGTVTVTGSGSTLGVTDELHVGEAGGGTLNIQDGGHVSCTTVLIGASAAAPGGDVTISGDSSLLSSSNLYVGGSTVGVLNVNGGLVDTTSLVIGNQSGSSGTVNLSEGKISADSLSFGDGAGTLSLTGGTLELVGNQMLTSDMCTRLSALLGSPNHTFSVTGSLALADTLDISGANVVAGSMSLSNLAKIDPEAGSLTLLTGTEVSSGSTFDLADDPWPITTTDTFEFHAPLDNYGSLRGNCTVKWLSVLTNHAGGDILVSGQESVRLLDTSQLDNAGDITVSGGLLELPGTVLNTSSITIAGIPAAAGTLHANDMANSGEISMPGGMLYLGATLVNTGTIAGYGTLRADGGTTNQGTVNLTALTGVMGAFLNEDTVNVLGGETITFFDDLKQDGTFYISSDSTIAVLGTLSGSAGFTGGGTVDLLPGATYSPGSSPAEVTFEGSLDLSSADACLIELGGLTPGEYDRSVVNNELSLGGDLSVSLLPEYTLGYDEEYEIFAAGAMEGMFDNYSQDDLVGTYGDMVLFIHYDADAGTVTLYTEVPEPATMASLGLGVILACGRRSRAQRQHR